MNFAKKSALLPPSPPSPMNSGSLKNLVNQNMLYFVTSSEYQERIQKLAQYKNIIEDHGDWKTFCEKKKQM